MRAEEPSESHVPKIYDRDKNSNSTSLAKNTSAQEAERGGGSPTKAWFTAPALWVASSRENLFLGEDHQGQGQGLFSSVHPGGGGLLPGLPSERVTDKQGSVQTNLKHSKDSNGGPSSLFQSLQA